MQENSHRSPQPATEPASNTALPDWENIDCVFLDMDGTLLDLNYDNYVWNELVPRAYARLRNISLDEARARLLSHMRDIHGSIEFYSFEYWINYTGIDLIATHESATQLLAYRPGALEFLRWLKGSRHTCIIATNAHPDSIRVKHAITGICDEVEAVVSSNTLAAPKESEAYWEQILRAHPHNPARCLFIDDNEPVLDSARHCGIGHLFAVCTPDSGRESRTGLRYPAFDHFAEICPAIAVQPTMTGRISLPGRNV